MVASTWSMIIAASQMITMNRGERPVEGGGVVVQRGRIVAVGPLDRLIRRYPAQRVLRLQEAVLMPGLINLHTHLELPPLLDTIKAESFPSWVLHLIRAKRSLTRSAYFRAVRDNISDILRCGTTTVGEICTQGESPDILQHAGIRSYVFPEVIQMCERPVAASSLRRCRRKTRTGLMTFGISPHSPYTVAAKVLRALRTRYGRGSRKIAMHVAESRDEIRLLQGKGSGLEELYHFAQWDPAWAPRGTSPVQYLHDIGLLNQNLIAVHAVFLSDRDVMLLKRSRVSVAHCPRSNALLSNARMPLKCLLDAGVTVGIGTDSLASVPTLNLWEEMRYAYRIHRKDGISPYQVFSLATVSGAQALGLGQEIGTLAAGKRADLIALPLPVRRTGDLYADILRETYQCLMNMVNGRVLYRDRSGTSTSSVGPARIRRAPVSR